MNRTTQTTRNDYRHFCTIQTRWMDNDAYGHVNNATYSSFFDTAIALFLSTCDEQIGADTALVRLVVSSQCQYFAPVSFPNTITVGIATAALGRSSVRYAVAVFEGDALPAAAQGEFVHVYVDPDTRRPMEIPDALRKRLAALL
jgi:acyl-CoA thioester hydrolase